MKNKLDLNVIPHLGINYITRILIKFLIFLRFSSLLGIIYVKQIKKSSAEYSKNTNRSIHLLALSPERFRGDLQVLTRSNEIKIWVVPTILQTLIQASFYKRKVVASELKNPDRVEYLKKRKNNHRIFLKKILKIIFHRLPIDLVISADIKYVADIDWGEVAENIGKSYIVLHRENLAACKSVKQLMVTRTNKIREFGGTKIIVHNKIMKSIFTKNGFAKKNQVSIEGCLRMDELFQKTKKNQVQKTNKITLFSFPPYQWARNIPFDVFVDCHSAFIRIAKNYPDIRVIIKPKYEYLVSKIWNELINKAFDKNNFNPKNYSNFSISPEMNSHDLILESNIICGFNSTIILEALTTGVPIVLPYFEILRTKQWHDRINFSDDMKIFFTPKNEEELLELLLKKGKKFQSDNKNKTEKIKIFKKYLHYYDQNILSKYIKVFKQLV